MALTGLDIFKQLPKTNCKECGLPTCLAFAMKVAGGQAGLDSCPRLSDDARMRLSEASAPPQRLVKFGPDSNSRQVGQETVLFRHEEKFHNPTLVALQMTDAGDAAAVREACASFKKLTFVRVGETIAADMVALINESGSLEKMVAAVGIVQKELNVPMILVSSSTETLKAVATGPLAGMRPLICRTGDVTVDELVGLAQKASAPVCVAGDVENVATTVEELGKKGIKDVVISPGPVPVREGLAFLTKTRRAALKKKYRALGCPVLAIACGDDKDASALDACVYVSKYAGIVVSDAWEAHRLVPILTTRQNIYTDPQKPVQVEPKLYEVGDIRPDSPLLITTNFSLSYYAVESEVEASRIPCLIQAVDTEGTSVLTGWAADKFNAETITKAIKAAGVEDKLKHRKMIIPGLVAVLSAQIEDASGWTVLVGPKDAAGIGPYLKSEWRG